MSQIVVEVGKQMEGATFQLSPHTRVALASETGEQLPAASIFVSYDAKHDFDSAQGPFWNHIVALLTGLSEDQIRRLGGFSVVSPAGDEILFESSSEIRCPAFPLSRHY